MKGESFKAGERVEVEKITVTLPSVSYEICIEKGLLSKAGNLLSQVTACKKAVMVTDETVDGLYGAGLFSNLTAEGFHVTKVVIPPG